MCDQESSELRRNPGFESAAIVLPSVDDCQKYLHNRIRVVGFSVKEFKGKVLTLQQGNRLIYVNVNEYYQNEHRTYRFIEVIGVVESVDSDSVSLLCYHLRGLQNFNMQLYCEAVNRRNTFLQSTFGQ